MHYNLF